jgi:hypothetical protein
MEPTAGGKLIWRHHKLSVKPAFPDGPVARPLRSSTPSRKGTQLEYRRTQSAMAAMTHSVDVDDEHSDREQALRRLPLPYSLALRLRDAGVAPDVICEYAGVEETSLAGVYRIAEAKLHAVQQAESARTASAAPPPSV